MVEGCGQGPGGVAKVSGVARRRGRPNPWVWTDSQRCGQSLPIGPEKLSSQGRSKSVHRAPSCGYPGVRPPLLKTVQSLSRVQLLATPWTAARQASLSITISWSLLKLVSIESVIPSNHLVLCRPLLLPPSIFPSIRVFSNESVLHIRWPNTGLSASASVLPMNIQD